MAEDQKRQILEHLFDNRDVPAHILDELSRWLLEHEGDPETEALMLEKWEEFSKALFEEDDLKGLKDIRQTIINHDKKATCCRKGFSTIALCLTAVILFIAGFASSSLLKKPVKEITLITANDNIGEFILPDGTKVWLNERSQLSYPENFKAERMVALKGEAFFEVRKDPERPFTLSMSDLEVEVLGTSFGASCYCNDNKEEVILKNGSVKISCSKSTTPVTLKPNERLTYSPFDGIVNVDTLDVANRYRWYERYLSFDNARFGDILANIEHRYRVQVKPLTSVSMDKRLSLTILHEPLETIMDVVSTLLPIKYEIHDDNLIIRDRY